MLTSFLGLFTGGSKWVYVALSVLLVGFIGTSVLSLSLYGDKSALKAIVEKQDKEIKEIKEKNTELSDTLIKKRTEIELQNTKIKENETRYDKNVDEAKKANSDIVSRYKKLIDQINSFKGDDNANASDVKQFVNDFSW